MTQRKLTWKAIFSAEGLKDLENMDNKFTKMGKNIEGVSGKMTKFGGSLMKKVSLPIAGVGAAAIKTGMDFDDGMAQVQALTGATSDDFDKLRDKAIQLGNDTAFSAMDASEGMQILAASGMATNDILETSGDMFTLMSAGSVDADTAASVLTNTMAQFNVKASESSRIVDVFAQGAASAKLGVDDLEYIMGQAGGTMASMNMDMEQSVAMAGQLANAGTPVGTIGTTLNAMGREIKANAKDFKKLGVSVYDSSGKLRDMGSVMGDLEKALDGKTNAQRDEALATVFSGQAQKGAVDWLSKGAKGYKELTNEMYESKGAADAMSEIMENTLGGTFRSLSSSIGTAMIEIADVIKEPLGKFAEFVQGVVDKFVNLDDETKLTIVKIAGIAAAIGPVLLVGGKLLGGIGKIIMFGGKIFSVISAVVGVLGGPLTVAIGIAIGAGIALYKNWDKVVTWFTGAKDKFIAFKDELKEKVTAKVDMIKKDFQEGVRNVKEGWGNLKRDTKENIQAMVTAVSTKFNNVVSGVKNKWNETKTNVGQAISGTITAVSDTFQSITTGVKNKWNEIKGLLSAGIKGTISAVADKFHAVIGKVREAWTNLKNFLSEPLQGTVNAVRKGAGWVKDRVTGSHRTGKDKIPHQGYISELHKDEMVLTKKTADDYRELGGTKDKLPEIGKPVLNRQGGKSIQADFNPTISINIEGNADESTARDIARETKKIVQNELDKFFIKLQLQG